MHLPVSRPYVSDGIGDKNDRKHRTLEQYYRIRRKGCRKVQLQQCKAHACDPASRAFQPCQKIERADETDARMAEKNRIYTAQGKKQGGGAENVKQPFSYSIGKH